MFYPSQSTRRTPLLFTLAMEPLAIAVRRSPVIGGFIRGSLEEKIVLYTENIYFFLSMMQLNLSPITLIWKFGSLSGLAINSDNYTLLSLHTYNTSSAESTLLEVLFRYLSIPTSVRLSDYCSINLLPPISKLHLKKAKAS